MKNVLITGATGFLGSNLVRYLNSCGIEPTIYRRQSSDLRNLEDCRYQAVIGNLDNKDEIKQAISTCNAVFNLAAHATLLDRDKNKRAETNINFIKILRDALLETNRNIRLVHCSSTKAVGFSTQPVILDEDSQFNAGEMDYALSKKMGEDILKEAAGRGLNVVIVNPATLIGPKGMKGIQKQTLIKVASGKAFFYPPGGSSFTYVEDVVKGMVAACEKGKSGERYILAGHNLTFKEYFQKIAAMTGAGAPRFKLPATLLPMAGKVMEICFHKMGRDTGKIAAGFGYYSSQKAINVLKYKITPLEQVIKIILSELNINSV